MNFPAINILKCVDMQKGMVLGAAATRGIYFVGRQWICSPCDRILSGEDAGILFLSQIVLDPRLRKRSGSENCHGSQSFPLIITSFACQCIQPIGMVDALSWNY